MQGEETGNEHDQQVHRLARPAREDDFDVESSVSRATDRSEVSNVTSRSDEDECLHRVVLALLRVAAKGPPVDLLERSKNHFCGA